MNKSKRKGRYYLNVPTQLSSQGQMCTLEVSAVFGRVKYIILPVVKFEKDMCERLLVIVMYRREESFLVAKQHI